MSASLRVLILIPVFNDWESVSVVVAQLANELAIVGLAADVVLVDDGSTCVTHLDASRFGGSIGSIDVIVLRRNLGHQRAIAIGLCHVESIGSHDVVVVMDGDGEDKPSDVPRLVAAAASEGRSAIVFAERTRRSEKLTFLLLYRLYTALHRLLTGERVRVGNFSAIPRAALWRLVAVSDLWNHYAAAVFRSRIPYTSIPTERGHRIAGASTMNYTALVTHGLSAMSIFGDRIGVRLLAAAVVLATSVAVALTASVVMFGARTPLWVAVGAGLLTLVLFQAASIVLAFVFIILASRANTTFLPLRDFRHYILRTEQLAPAVRA